MTTPIAQYLFKDNGNDETGTYNGTAANVTYEAVPAGKNFGGKVAIFNGTNAVIDIGNNFGFTTQDFALEFWFDTASRSGTRPVFAKGQYTTGGYYFDTDVQNIFRIFAVGSVAAFLYGDDGTDWQHIVTRRSGTTIELFENGVSVGSTSGVPSSIVNPAVNFYLGKYGTNNNWYSGKIANFRVYQTNIPDAAEIAAHYAVESRPPSGFFMFM